MKLDMVQARQFSVLLGHFLSQVRKDTIAEAATELGIPIGDYNHLVHWPRLCTKRALAALRVVENEIAATEWGRRGD